MHVTIIVHEIITWAHVHKWVSVQLDSGMDWTGLMKTAVCRQWSLTSQKLRKQLEAELETSYCSLVAFTDYIQLFLAWSSTESRFHRTHLCSCLTGDHMHNDKSHVCMKKAGFINWYLDL